MNRHPVTVVGAWLVTLSAFAFLFVFFLDVFGIHHSPYVGLVFFVILPMFFGVHLPLAKTMIAITFIAGLLPVIGNLLPGQGGSPSHSLIPHIPLPNIPGLFGR